MSDIEQILYPTVLSSLREDIPPVQIIVWKGADEYETIQFDKVYPFDTIDDIKRLLCAHYESDTSFIPKFTFLGVKIGDDAYTDDTPTLETTYVPIDYLWYPSGTNDPRMTYILSNPRKSLVEPDMRFVTADGSYSSPNFEPRGRSTIEDIFLRPREGRIPTFHAFTLKTLINEYRGTTPVSEADWNKRFAPYFPNVSVSGPYEPDTDDREFAKKVRFFVLQRETTLDALNNLLEEGVEVPVTKVSGIRQLRLIWKKPVRGFEGAGSLFYNLLASERRPFIRLLPADGSGITKLHVKGVLPIPTLDDPKILEVWGRETSPTPGIDYCVVKYVHRPPIGITQPIYGTIQILNDGTMNLLLQPPKQIRKLDPVLDFRNFTRILEDVFTGLPQTFDEFKLKEIAALFSLKIGVKSKKFNKTRLLRRLPFFQTFFQEIKSLPGENPLISLRYKAVSQYASEDKTFTFLTQFATSRMLDGEAATTELITALQDEFKLSKKEAVDVVAKWFEQRGTFTVQLPEEGEFIESFNPGIDIHIYAQHPSYYFHVNRVDSYDTYIRLFTLLSLLFVEEDDYFITTNVTRNTEMEEITNDIEAASLAQEEGVAIIEDEKNRNTTTETATATAVAASIKNEMTPTMATANSIPDWMIDDPFANAGNALNEGEVIPETAPSAIEASTKADEPVTTARKRPPIVSENVPSEEKPAPVTPVTAVTTVSKPSDDEQKLVNPKSWFIKKLQEADPRLFSFRTEDSDDNGYSRKCAGFDDRQPSVLTKDQYDRMREIYEDDPIFWIIYPLEGDEEPIQPLGVEETITLMRYGADPESINYYFCPQYFCLSDEIMVREVDFESTSDRDGNPKPPNTCPFCYGKLISDKKKAVPGHTVFKRKDKRGSTYHAKIDFMSKTTHPENFALPCCFLKQTTLRISDPQYSHLRSYLQDEEIENVSANEEAKTDKDEEEEELVYRADEAIEYAVLFETLYRSYILEPNKHPGPGIFATAPSKFDKFFRQDSSESIVTRVKISLKLRPNASGFLRVGTENTLYESLLGVIAPLLYKNSINEVRERILEILTPRIFLNSHFGNLVLEFYNPADGSAMPPTKQELMTWSQNQLGVAITSTNIYQVLRIYNSFKRFIRFIRDPTQRKDLRHIQPLLAEPGLFTTRGIQLVVMEDNDADDNSITIRCPTFGVSLDRNKKNDFVFISRSMKNIGATENKYARYELFIHTSNKAAKGGEGEIHETIIRWDYNSRRYWPEIVQRRVDEYMNQCQSRYRSLYTSQDGINPMAMIPLSKAVDAAPVRPEGIVKDSYNHIVAITFRAKAGSSNLVALPIVDDGVISISSAFSIKNIYLDWDDFKAATVDEIVRYYKANLEPLFSLYPGYFVKYIVKRKADNKIVAVQLENGIYIPATAPKDESVLAALGINTVTIEEFQSEIDKRIAGIQSRINTTTDWSAVLKGATKEKSCGFDSELLRKSTYVQFEELYQQFRLMVSNWLTSYRAGSEIRKGIEDIIFNEDLPEYERRKRLYIFIASTLLSWFYPDDEKWESQVSFLRRDCRLIESPDTCTGTCYWKADEGTSGRCLLHVDAKTQLGDKPGERDVSTPELFTKRIIDELVRFPLRRRQLMKRGEISKVSTIISPIRQGDQYIIPEASPTWTNLLRLDWARQIPEEPKYYEEMSRKATPEDEVPPKGELPPELVALLGEDTPLRLRVPDVPDSTQPLMPFTGILGMTLDQLGLSDDATTITLDNLNRFVLAMSKPVGLIDFRSASGGAGASGPKIDFVRPMTGSFESVTIFVLLPTQIGLLIQEDGDSTVKNDVLPEEIQAKWRDATIIRRPKKPVIAPLPEEEVKVPVLIGKKPIKTTLRRRPLIADLETPPLVEAPPRSNNIVRKTLRKRPQIVSDTPMAAVPKTRKRPPIAPNGPTTTENKVATTIKPRKRPQIIPEPTGGVPETKGDD